MMDPGLEPVRLPAPAKVNLCLAVGPPRPDGYHSLVSLAAALTLEDRITLEPSSRLEVLCNHPEVPQGEANLAYRAAHLAALEAGREPRVRIRIDKEIPVAAGLAGGSTDAAAVLAGLRDLWGLPWRGPELASLALRLGADVPFCLHGGVAVMEGVGERLSPQAGLPSLHLVVAVPRGARISTADAYRELDRRRPQGTDLNLARARVEEALRAWRAGDLRTLGAAFFNDLEPVARQLQPVLDGLIGRLEAAGALGVVVSGSGPATLGLCPDAEAAEAVASALRAAGYWARRAATRSGPTWRFD
ncbi:MAG TPA: 4-(cytidine 5'-diphospho)-2-C-methyl-D-erythritol kinase [Limnochorda sp.]